MRKRQICLWASLLFFCLTIVLAGISLASERYRVKSGDSLYKISKKFRVSVEAIQEANPLTGNTLKQGQALVIPGADSAGKSPGKSAAKTVYVVKKGDTLTGLSDKTGVPVADIRKMNGLRSAKLKTGQRLHLANAPVRAEEDDDDSEEMGSVEAGELSILGDGPVTSTGIAPLELGTWKTPGERDLFVKVVKSYEGVPYQLGGNSLRGIDCSAFTRKVYGIFNIDLPRTAREQMQRGKRVGRDELDVGDLVFFQTRRTRIHVGIYLGGSEFFHLSSRNRAGKVDKIDAAYFSTRFIGGIRMREAARQVTMETPAISVEPAQRTPPVSVRDVFHPPGG